jgi:hypothetical protein
VHIATGSCLCLHFYTDYTHIVRSQGKCLCRSFMGEDATVQEQVNCSVQVGCSVNRAATGRTINYETPEHNLQEELVKQWVNAENRDALLSHPVAIKFRSFVSETPVVDGNALLCYRGCYKRSDMHPCPLPIHFGPPPPAATDSGRYNNTVGTVLYLCTSSYGVAYEKQEDKKPIKDLFCQEYILDLSILRLADFSHHSLDNFIQIVFDYAEYGMRRGGIDKDDYTFSQIVSDIVNQCGFSGMSVPGVRGTPERRYQNIIIFNPEVIWRRFVNMDVEPVCIDNILSSYQEPIHANQPTQKAGRRISDSRIIK